MNYTVRQRVSDWFPWNWLRHRCKAGHIRKLPPSAWFIDRWNAQHGDCRPRHVCGHAHC